MEGRSKKVTVADGDAGAAVSWNCAVALASEHWGLPSVRDHPSGFGTDSSLYEFSWAVREVIPYIRAVRLVPTVMKQKLPAEYIKALDTTVGTNMFGVIRANMGSSHLLSPTTYVKRYTRSPSSTLTILSSSGRRLMPFLFC